MREKRREGRIDEVQGGRGERRGETRCMGDEVCGRQGARGARETRCKGDEARGRSLTACSSHSVISLVLIEYKNTYNCILK